MEDGMSKTKKMPKSLFLGRWHIVSMSTWNEDYINEEFPAFIEFDDKGDGSSQFAYVRGGIDYRITTRDGEPAVEWSWEGNAAARGRKRSRSGSAARGQTDLEVFVEKLLNRSDPEATST